LPLPGELRCSTYRNKAVAGQGCAHEKQKQKHCHSIISGRGFVPGANRHHSVQPVLDHTDNAPNQSDHPDYDSPLASCSLTAGSHAFFGIRITVHLDGLNVTND